MKMSRDPHSLVGAQVSLAQVVHAGGRLANGTLNGVPGQSAWFHSLMDLPARQKPTLCRFTLKIEILSLPQLIFSLVA